MAELIEKAAVLRVIFDNVGKPATEIYQNVRELPAADAPERAGWVRASERMPELGPWATFPDEDEDGGLTSYRQTKPVLVIDETGEMSLAEYHQEKWDEDERMRFDEWISLPDLGTFKGVIWWAPTPEPPEDGT